MQLPRRCSRVLGLHARCECALLRQSPCHSSQTQHITRCIRCRRIENGKVFEEVYLDKVIAEERDWRGKTDIDVQMGIARDEKTQLVLASR